MRERQREGTALAKVRGVHLGRARQLDVEQVAEVRQLAASGVPTAKTG